MEEAVGMAAVFAADTTAVAGTGMLATIAGMAVGAGGAVVGTRGGCFRFQSLTLILITGGTTAQAMAMVRVTVTDEDTDFRSEEVSQVALKSHQSLPLLPPIHN
jgi:hypothetical protein